MQLDHETVIIFNSPTEARNYLEFLAVVCDRFKKDGIQIKQKQIFQHYSGSALFNTIVEVGNRELVGKAAAQAEKEKPKTDSDVIVLRQFPVKQEQE